ncbi:MAG: hypothetical protein EU544_06415, partial [Promethearchaeota archaeon]
MRYYLLVLNIINFLLFIWIIAIFNGIFNFEAVVTNPEEELVITDVINALRNIGIYLIYLCAYLVGVVSALAVAGIFGAFPYYSTGFMF